MTTLKKQYADALQTINELKETIRSLENDLSWTKASLRTTENQLEEGGKAWKRDAEEQDRELADCRQVMHEAISNSSEWASKCGKLQANFDCAIELHEKIVEQYKKQRTNLNICFWVQSSCCFFLILIALGVI